VIKPTGVTRRIYIVRKINIQGCW